MCAAYHGVGYPWVTFVLGCHNNSEAGSGRLLFRVNLSIPPELDCAVKSASVYVCDLCQCSLWPSDFALMGLEKGRLSLGAFSGGELA